MIKKRDLPADQFSHTRWSNVNTKETEKLSMCRNLEIEVSRIWEVRTKSVPVITAAVGTIKGGLGEPSVAPRSPVGHTAKKIALMSGAHGIRKGLGSIALICC